MKDDNNINWTKLNHFSQFGGFRYEDCIAVTENGIENLSQAGFDKLK